MKHLIILASIAVLTIGAAACTREKPTNETPPPQVAASDLTTTPGAPGAATVAPGSPPAPTDTPVVTSTVVVAPTSVPTAVLPTSVPVVPLVPVSTPTPSASAPGTYTVQWGDWLNKIAQQFGVSTQAIVDANPGLNPNLIYPGQVLKIPAPGTTPPSSGGVTPPTTNPGTYTVQRGDWIYAIARRFGVTVPALLAANPGINPNFVPRSGVEHPRRRRNDASAWTRRQLYRSAGRYTFLDCGALPHDDVRLANCESSGESELYLPGASTDHSAVMPQDSNTTRGASEAICASRSL